MTKEDRTALLAEGRTLAGQLDAFGPPRSRVVTALCDEIEHVHGRIDEFVAGEEMMTGAAIDVIRQLLDRNHVPEAAFIDDHVGNAVVQRNKLVACLLDIRTMLEEGSDPSDIFQRIDSGFTAAKVEPKVLTHVEEKAPQDSEAS